MLRDKKNYLSIVFVLLPVCQPVYAEAQHTLSLDWLSYKDKFEFPSGSVTFEPNELTIGYSMAHLSGFGFSLRVWDGNDTQSISSNNGLENEVQGYSATASYLYDDSWIEIGASASESSIELENSSPSFDYRERSESIELFIGYGMDWEIGAWLVSPSFQVAVQESKLKLYRRNLLDLERPNLELEQEENGGYFSSNLSGSYPYYINDDALLLGSLQLSWAEGLWGDGISRSSVYDRQRTLSLEDSLDSKLEGRGTYGFALSLFWDAYGVDFSLNQPFSTEDDEPYMSLGLSLAY